MKRKRFMQCNLLSINIFLEDFSNDNVVVHVRFELTIFVTTISRRFLPLKGIIMRTAKKMFASLVVVLLSISIAPQAFSIEKWQHRVACMSRGRTDLGKRHYC